MLKSLTRFIKYKIVFKNLIQYQKLGNHYSPVVCSHHFRNQFHSDLPDYNADNERDGILQTSDNLSQSTSVLTAINVDHVTSITFMNHADKVLQFLRNNSNVETAYYEPLLSTIVQLQRDGKTNLSNDQLCRTEEIILFLQKVNKNVGLLHLNDVLNIFKTLLFLEIPLDSLLIQHILQRITENINRMNLKQLLVLSNLINHRLYNEQIDGLKIALSIIIDNMVRSHIKHTNPADVAKIFVEVFNNKIFRKETVEFLIDSTYKIKDRLDCKDSFRILMCLNKRNRTLSKKMILYYGLMKNVTINMHDSLKFPELIRLVHVSVDNFIHVDVSYYNHELILGAIDYIIVKQGTLNMAGSLLRILNRISYQSIEKLLDYMDEKIFHLKNLHDIYRISPFISFIKACANISYKPKYWDVYQDDLISLIDEKKTLSIPIIDITLNFIVMNCWVSSLIEHCFSEQYLGILFNRKVNHTIDYLELLNLYQFVQIFYPGGYKKSLPPTHMIEKGTKLRIHPVFANLIDVLAHEFGGYKYVLNGVRTRFGHYLDHLIVKDKNGNMIVINENENKGISETIVESLNIPVNSSLIAIIYLAPSSYLLDGIQMRGKTKLIIKSIEECGIFVIPVAAIQINKLSDYEKTSYLLKEIESKMKKSNFSKCKDIKTCAHKSNLPH